MTEKQQNFIGYVRVSTKLQTEGNSLQIQTDAIKKYCEYNKYNLLKVYKDEGISAVANRPAFKNAFRRVIEDDNVHGIIVYDLTRFGRSIVELLLNIKEIDEKGKKFISLKENIDLSSKTGRLMLGVLAAIAEFERDTIRERMMAGKERAKMEGTKSGKPMHRPKKEIDWDKVMELRKKGVSWTATSKFVGVTPATLIKRAREEGYYEK